MAEKSSVSILCFLFLIICFVSAQDRTCDESHGIFKPNSSYDKNRRLILSNMASNVMAHDSYFNGSVGLGSDRVNAIGMCAPGTEPDACSSCINDAAGYLLQICLNQTNAFSWFGEEIICLVRYSNRPFNGLLILEPYKVFFNDMDIKKNILKEFYSLWDVLMSRMITGASSSVKYYAKDVAPVPVYGDISVLMQCTLDVSSENCKLCLESSVDYYKRRYLGKRGVITLRPSCFFRWEVYRFSGAFDNATYVTSPPSSVTSITKKDTRISSGIVAAIVIIIVVTLILTSLGLVILKRRKQNQATTALQTESVQFDLKTIEVATSNFSESNKLGEGGFGDVYKGVLPDGTEVAVKRLSKRSGQGKEEFKNEVLVVAKLQHRNLVRLLGFSLQGEEKLLVYEFVSNKSLDYFLFDSMKRAQLEWRVRHKSSMGLLEGFYIFIKIHGSQSYTVTLKRVTFS
ncbi:unnamed protein product [Microthlaspi erraticum]|uniref:Uncharacterized protein n=1 Tax=Microthlaspi erraticum TaxID=1685480 RepID=A0A6D2IDD6_9BRAS|nr:unnamed protein product [Microthlaspi erraticum]